MSVRKVDVWKPLGTEGNLHNHPHYSIYQFFEIIKITYQYLYFGIGSNPVSELGWVDQVIGYTSRTLSKSEHKYLAHKLEFLA